MATQQQIEDEVTKTLSFLKTGIDGKAPKTHTHTTAQVTGLDSHIAAEVNKISPSIVPPGMILAFAGKTVPNGWLLCNGAAVSRTTYANLFQAIGTAWGAGDGSTTFNLPNFTGRVVQGTANPAEVGKYLEASLPNITGEFFAQQLTTPPNTAQLKVSGALFASEPQGSESSTGSYQKCHGILLDASRANSIYVGTALQPRSGISLFLIKI